jgi:hypothetical protein
LLVGLADWEDEEDGPTVSQDGKLVKIKLTETELFYHWDNLLESNEKKVRKGRGVVGFIYREPNGITGCRFISRLNDSLPPSSPHLTLRPFHYQPC